MNADSEVLMKTRLFLFPGLIFTLCLFSATGIGLAQGEGQHDTMVRAQAEDPIQQLNLTPEQRQQIRIIREQMRDERAAINQRLREANLALELALDADEVDEAVIEQRLRDVASAQAAQMRMRVLSEVRIRRVLNPAQRALLREIRQAMQFRRQRQMDNPRRPLANPDGRRRFPNQGNTLGPYAPNNQKPRP